MSKPINNRPSGFRTMLLLLLTWGAAALLISCVSAGTGVTISTEGGQSYYLGEDIVLRGLSPDAGTVYLLLTGPNLPAAGAQLTSPDKAVVSGNADSFTSVKTQPDTTWEYTLHTATLPLDSGVYTIFATGEPKAKDRLDTGAASVNFILKRPFTGVTISDEGGQSYYLGEDIVLRGLSPDTDTVYLFMTGPNLPATGVKLTSPGTTAVSGNPDTFTVATTNPDTIWEYTLHTATLPLDSGVYTIFATGEPKAKDRLGAGAAGVNFILKRPFTGVTISADGDQSYYLGEKVVLRGLSPDTDTVYLFMTGPTTFKNGPGIPASGGKLTSPLQAVVNGNADSFTSVKTQPDKAWTYSWYTSGLKLDAGTYTLYAVGQPNATDQLGAGAANVGIIIKKPFISGAISSPDIVQGQPFTVTGIAEGLPPDVRIWIFGDNYAYTSETPVQSDASFTFNADATLSGKIPTGQNYLIVDHPMADNRSDFVVSGEYIRSLKPNNGKDIVRITGSGSLQGSDAADVLIEAISAGEAHDHTYTNDTYALIPFRVTAAGTTTSQPPAATTVPTEKPAVFVIAQGDGSYYLGEKVSLSGRNTGSDSTYLFLTGPNLQATGVQLTAPDKAVVSGNPETFTSVKTRQDTTWDYPWYTSGLKLDAGSYTLYAVSMPLSEDRLAEAPYGTTSIIIKKPFIAGTISPATVSRGQPFTVTGTAEGDPPEIRIWIFGDNYAYTTTTPVLSDTTFTFTADAALSGNLPTGQNYLIAEHPMADNQADFVVSGEYVRDLQNNSSANLFKITGPGSLQGSDAADALIEAISTGEAHDGTYTHDTYFLIPFQVTAAGITTAPVQQSTTHAPFDNALHSLEEALRSFF